MAEVADFVVPVSQAKGTTIQISRFLSRARKMSPGTIIALLVVLTVLLAAVVPSIFTSYDPLLNEPAIMLQAPSVEHLFGTDKLGRDIFARVVYGSRTTILATVIAVSIGLVIGSFIGLVSGFAGGRVDGVIMRFVDVLLAIPSLLLAMTVVTALGFGTVNVAIAVGIGAVASFSRVMRAEVLRVRSSTYVEAAFAGGDRIWWVLLRHILPNSLGPVLAMAALEFGTAVLAVSTLSFLGYGVVPPDPEWGSLISDGRAFLATSWWMTTLPGLVVVAVILSANQVGRSIDKSTKRFL